MSRRAAQRRPGVVPAHSKHSDTDFQLVRIGFRNGDLASMFLADKLNQVTQLTFSHLRATRSLRPTVSFVPPAGVDVIGRAAK